MKVYKVKLTESAEESYDDLIGYMAELDFGYAHKFKVSFTNNLANLSTIPNRGKQMNLGFRGILIMEYIIIYYTDDEKEQVTVVDIIEPRQHSKSRRYIAI